MARKISLPPGTLRRFRLPDPGGREAGVRVVPKRWGTRLLGALALTLFTLFVYWLSVSAFWLPSAAEERPQPPPRSAADQRLPAASGSTPR
jgi:hypothetical protein